ncbi:pyridoxamine 5'-phosphate oxidase family protein [Ruicaihuangia caeni]|uniref:Pyridoxamine 5'-phosphate oxidase family protein n=1 Tax=Ruicaihuangia caeni TaxID=3042517 RepID=A0AAW6T2T3_9MICO|nr:pyridoxamine 5'-phosphate oxidase family protein [Klugiella sp. YN-L-19]MDI2097629.1 pyridoxamine 5'-phosphate oxidase family protein [Klugiella sp. YN-L-19]
MGSNDAVRKVHRHPERQRVDRDALYRLLDEELVGHLAMVVGGEPLIVPMAYARVADALLLHGSTGGGFALRAATEGHTVAFSVTALDGIVVARSLFDHSMNYRSAVVYGELETLGPAEEDAALIALSERLLPGRPSEVRANTRKELAATRVVRLPLADAVFKVRDAGPGEAEDDGEDHHVWAGVVPARRGWGAPVVSALTEPDAPLPPSVRRLIEVPG